MITDNLFVSKHSTLCASVVYTFRHQSVLPLKRVSCAGVHLLRFGELELTTDFVERLSYWCQRTTVLVQA
jgi:hypothetical protein